MTVVVEALQPISKISISIFHQMRRMKVLHQRNPPRKIELFLKL